jgi:hypothetical protein
MFSVKLFQRADSPLNVPGLGLVLTREDILDRLCKERRPR